MSTVEYRQTLHAKHKKERFKRVVLQGLSQLTAFFKVEPVNIDDIWVVEYKGRTYRNPSPVQAMRDLATVNGYLTRQIEAEPESIELAVEEVGTVTLSSGEPPYVISDRGDPEMVLVSLEDNILTITALSAGEEGETYITVSDSFEPVDSIEIEVKISG